MGLASWQQWGQGIRPDVHTLPPSGTPRVGLGLSPLHLCQAPRPWVLRPHSLGGPGDQGKKEKEAGASAPLEMGGIVRN